MRNLRYILDFLNICAVTSSSEDDTHSSSGIDIVRSHQSTSGIVDESCDLYGNVLKVCGSNRY